MRIVICFPNVICAAVTPRLESIWIGIDEYVSWTKIAEPPPASCVLCKARLRRFSWWFRYYTAAVFVSRLRNDYSFFQTHKQTVSVRSTQQRSAWSTAYTRRFLQKQTFMTLIYHIVVFEKNNVYIIFLPISILLTTETYENNHMIYWFTINFIPHI